MEVVMTTIVIDGKRYPARWEICESCHGNGTHGNPAFDGLSLNDEIFMDDLDFLDEYLHTDKYDVLCEECDGSGKVLIEDYDACTEQQKKELDIYALENEDDGSWIPGYGCPAERAMGA